VTNSPASRYATASIALHWLMFILIAAVYATIELRELFPRGSDPRNLLKSWHFMLGLSVLALVVLRVLARLTQPTPPIVPAPAAWQRKLAALGHLALYGLMFAMPLAGWIILSAEGKDIPFFGLSLPPLVGVNEGLAHDVEELHETVGSAGYWLIGFHAAAALFHHYLLKDNTLQRMLPGRGGN
jgi:superoxide oxidase